FDSPGSSCPSTRSWPPLAIACPVSSRIVVDLPAPLGPSRPRQMPSGTSRSSPSTAVIVPKRLTTPRSSIAAMRRFSMIGGAGGELALQLSGALGIEEAERDRGGDRAQGGDGEQARVVGQAPRRLREEHLGQHR